MKFLHVKVNMRFFSEHDVQKKIPCWHEIFFQTWCWEKNPMLTFPTWCWEKIPCQHGAPFPDVWASPSREAISSTKSPLTLRIVPPQPKSIMVSNLFNQVTTETTYYAYTACTGAPPQKTRTRTDSHFWSFRNAPITLRILLICDSYPLFLCLCIYSTYFLTCSLFCPYCYSRCWRLSRYSLSKGRLFYSFIFVHISYIFIFRSQTTFILGELSETILLLVESGGSKVGHVPLDVRNDWE